MIEQKITLLQGDCLELMKEIPDESVDMVLADLPFGTTCNSWDSVISLDRLWEQYHRICKPNAAVLIFGQLPFSAVLMMSNMKELRYEWIYEKTNATGFLNAKKMPLKAHESVFVFYRKLPTYNPQKTDGKPYMRGDLPDVETYKKGISMKGSRSYGGKRYPRDVLIFKNSGYGLDRGLHPTQKPVALLEYLIRTYTNESETVLDNTMGSGSTGVAAVNTGRFFIGMELDKNYFDIAKNRIEETVKNKVENNECRR